MPDKMIHVDLEYPASVEERQVVCLLSIQSGVIVSRLKFHLDRGKYLQASLFEFAVNGECYEPDYTSIMMKVLRPGDTVIDIGANFGYFSLLASSLVTETGRVIALEPEKDNFNYLTRNIELNNISNVRALNIAAGDMKKEVDLFIDPFNDGGHSLSGISPESSQQLGDGDVLKSRVQIDTLDSLLKEEKITSIKIIKIDTEGWEFHTIQGALSIIRRLSPPMILAEVNRNGLRKAGASERHLRLIMSELGYSSYVAKCLGNGKIVLELVAPNHYAEPELEHYNYNAVFARPEALADLCSCYYIFD